MSSRPQVITLIHAPSEIAAMIFARVGASSEAFAVKTYIAFDKQPEADVARIYDLYKQGNIFERVPYVMGGAVSSIVAQQADPRLAADMKAFDFHKVVDNSVVDRLVKEGFLQQLFGPGIRAEEQSKAKLAFR